MHACYLTVRPLICVVLFQTIDVVGHEHLFYEILTIRCHESKSITHFLQTNLCRKTFSKESIKVCVDQAVRKSRELYLDVHNLL